LESRFPLTVRDVGLNVAALHRAGPLEPIVFLHVVPFGAYGRVEDFHFQVSTPRRAHQKNPESELSGQSQLGLGGKWSVNNHHRLSALHQALIGTYVFRHEHEEYSYTPGAGDLCRGNST